MKNYRTELINKRVVFQTVCDACSKVEGLDPDGWHHFNSYHHDWGNDSIESHEDHDACSWPCYLSIVREVFEGYHAGTHSTLVWTTRTGGSCATCSTRPVDRDDASSP